MIKYTHVIRFGFNIENLHSRQYETALIISSQLQRIATDPQKRASIRPVKTNYYQIKRLQFQKN